MEIETLPNRAEIIETVRLGHISPTMAERWNRNMDWDPFPEFRDKASFNPLLESQWTLPMAAAWFIWRSVEAVRDQWPKYRRAWLTTVDPHTLRPELEVSLPQLFRRADFVRLNLSETGSDKVSNQASERLSRMAKASPQGRFEAALASGTLNVTGVSTANLARTPISSAVLRPHINRLVYGEAIARTSSTRTIRTGPQINQALQFNQIQVYCAEIIDADERASQADFDDPCWTLEHVLGWIAHRNPRRFRRLSLIDYVASPGSPNSDWEMTYAFDFVDHTPENTLRSARAAGQLEADFAGSLSSTRELIPIPNDWWHDGNLAMVPELQFSRDRVIKLWETIALSQTPNTAQTSVSVQHGKPPKYETLEELPPMLANVIDIMRDKWPQKNWPSSQQLRCTEIETEYVQVRKLGNKPSPSMRTIKRALQAFDGLLVSVPWEKL